MATTILPQSNRFAPSPDTVRFALDTLTSEREQMEALAIVLRERLEYKERNDEGASTELVLIRMLEEKLSSTRIFQGVEVALTGVNHG